LIALTAKERVTDVASAMAHAVTDAGNAAIAMTPDISKNGLVRSQAR
jgi:hypothetical protein